MACLAVDHSHINGNNPVTGHRYPHQCSTTTQLAQLQTTLSLQMNKPAFQLKPLGAALRLKTPQKKQLSTIQRNLHKQLYDSLTNTPVARCMILSQSTSHAGAHLMQPSSEACEAEHRCFRVSVARRLLLPHPAAHHAADVVQSCPNKSAAGLICTKLVDTLQHTAADVGMGEVLTAGMQQRPECPADTFTQWHQGIHRTGSTCSDSCGHWSARACAWISSSTSTDQSHTWMSPLLLLSLAIRLWSQQPAPDQDTWPKELKKAHSTDTHTSTSSLSYSRRPGPHARKFISNLMRDADNPPPAIRETWSAVQNVLHSAISKQQLAAAVA